MPLFLPVWLLFTKDGGWLFVRPKRSFQWYHQSLGWWLSVLFRKPWRWERTQVRFQSLCCNNNNNNPSCCLTSDHGTLFFFVHIHSSWSVQSTLICGGSLPFHVLTLRIFVSPNGPFPPELCVTVPSDSKILINEDRSSFFLLRLIIPDL